MKSMTGYGCGETVSKGTKIFVELSSVNRRQLEVTVNLPSEIEALDIIVLSICNGLGGFNSGLSAPSG